MPQEKWFNRKFDFTSNQNIFPSIIERLSGTPARLEEKLSSIAPAILTVMVDNTWTIKENIGHLTDLEPLWQGRLEDILAGRKDMRPTDLQNRKTTEANHNATPIEMLLKNFREIRMQTMRMIEPLNEAQIFSYALHPRLQTPMRTMDLFLFTAEHDDHHLARITELVRLMPL
ncbi:DinB family protein [Foetidibacter luteolus]|uniref:DinB family protein n=1 Tax=Foetidibacter luteolus TaxID=2608880 RepID=UPI00129A8CBC|nr:DinB family protein [Foetidibacter luteolus]